MKTTFWMICSSLFILLILATDSFARLGKGGSFGPRQSSPMFSTPKKSEPTQVQRPATTQPQVQRQAGTPARAGFFGGGIGGFLVGGMIGSLLLGGVASAAGGATGGVGLLDLIFLGAMVFFLVKAYKSRTQNRQDPKSDPWSIGSPQQAEPLTESEIEEVRPTEAQNRDVARSAAVSSGLAHIRQMDSGFREDEFLRGAQEAFTMLQTANANREIEKVDFLLDSALLQDFIRLQKEAEVREEKHAFEQLEILSAQIVEALQQSGADSITVEFTFSVIDFTCDKDGRIIDGSMDPAQFTEYWRFMRNIGDEAWQVISVLQPEEYKKS
ncbi:Tim44 domain-containing protein [Chrysiogenes arsenatis]|uniref:Tim44 domain-containing protein n=1 Tax=Chrysiogenes arsenatis TaxID=309797 RepID=UPI000412AA0D|nr:Tim44-like domain-containing protein [Chrysiogenes arsenatis]